MKSYKGNKTTKDFSVIEDETQLNEIFGLKPETHVEELPEIIPE